MGWAVPSDATILLSCLLQARETFVFPGGSDGRVCPQCGRLGFNPWVGKIPWRRKWQPTPGFLPGESHGQRSLAGYSPWGRKELDMTEWYTHTHTHIFLELPCPSKKTPKKQNTKFWDLSGKNFGPVCVYPCKISNGKVYHFFPPKLLSRFGSFKNILSLMWWE